MLHEIRIEVMKNYFYSGLYFRRRLYKAVAWPSRILQRLLACSLFFKFLLLYLVPLHMVETMLGKNYSMVFNLTVIQILFL